MDKDEQQAFEEGSLAASNKKRRSVCPYEEGSELAEYWNEGYDSVESVDEDGEQLDDE